MILLIVVYQLLVVDNDLESRIIAEETLKIELLARDVSSIVINKNDANANAVLLNYADNDDHIEFAAILLNNNSLLGYYSAQQDIPLPPMDTSQAVRILDASTTLTINIINGSDRVGYLWVQYDKSKLLAPQRLYYYFLAILAILMIIFSILLARVYYKRIMNPVVQMTHSMLSMLKQGKYESPLELNENSFLDRLANGFNQVVANFRKQESALLARITHLNKLLDVRTKQLFKKSHYDALTGLPNRYLLVDRLGQSILKARRNESHLALLFLDLDRFKVINDNFGHEYGDQLLKEVAKRLKSIAREGDTVARLGGDEFVFLLETLNQPKDAARTALRVIEAFAEVFNIQDHLLHISTSIGISIYPSDGDDDKKLLKNADVSMYHAKKKGPGNFSYYSKDMNNASQERLDIENHLRNAIENNELRLAYQPQMRLKLGTYKNVEALIRWRNPELGDVSPVNFIPIAEETGLIKTIDLWVISEACKQMRLWQELGLDDMTVAINVSAGHLISETLLDHIKTEIIVNQLKAEHIEIEITEQVFVEQTDRTIQNLKRIKELGAKIAIDDFGTGYSSLQYIQDFHADTLKLDGMFIDKLETDKASQGIVRSTIILAQSLGLELVAECVENENQFNFLKENHCDLIQGYYLSKPLEASEIPGFCQMHN
ncbi:MAG: EAL domain-containing protein [Kangiellaceae bacterium]|nr:EAL domain-containing protein [Kangiellaceae bacterium]